MTISVQQFRIRIGCFQPSGIKFTRGKLRRSANISFSWLYIFLHLSLAYDMQLKYGEVNTNLLVANKSFRETVSNSCLPSGLHGFQYQNVNSS